MFHCDASPSLTPPAPAPSLRLEEAGLPEPCLKEWWGHLRRVLIHFLRDIIPNGTAGAGCDSQSATNRRAAEDDARAYASTVDLDPDVPSGMLKPMLKPNVHWLQHAGEFEGECGALATMLVFWVER